MRLSIVSPTPPLLGEGGDLTRALTYAYQLYPPPPPVGAVPGAYFNHESHLRVGHNQVLLSMVGPDGPHGMWLSFAVRNFRKWLLFYGGRYESVHCSTGMEWGMQ